MNPKQLISSLCLLSVIAVFVSIAGWRHWSERADECELRILRQQAAIEKNNSKMSSFALQDARTFKTLALNAVTEQNSLVRNTLIDEYRIELAASSAVAWRWILALRAANAAAFVLLIIGVWKRNMRRVAQ